MSDKSFGDHPNRNIVKNPLLSSAVTGLSIEDLTHKAVLLPVTPSQGLITRPDQQQGPQARALAHTDHGTATLPSGDALQNIPLSNTTPISNITNKNTFDNQNIVKHDKNRITTQSKASPRSEDDFDVNEYIARLQGTRYVSAPLHSHHKEDNNANLEATEENLEEINLNESQSPVEPQQSLTADIAQNFSQLPAVLPHMASAVFSSFSNMLYKSREQTPDVNPGPVDQRYSDMQFQRPEIGVPTQVEEFAAPREVGPPPKEPPVGGGSNFRLTTRKKYAQIPGLSSGDAQTMTFGGPTPFGQPPSFGQCVSQMVPQMPPMAQVPPSFPPMAQNLPPMAHPQNMLPIEHSMQQNLPLMAQASQNLPPPNFPVAQAPPSVFPIEQSMTQNLTPTVQVPPIAQAPTNVPPIEQSVSQNLPPMTQAPNLPPMAQVPPSLPPMAKAPPSLPPSMAIGQTLTATVQPFGQSVPLVHETGTDVKPQFVQASTSQTFVPIGPNIGASVSTILNPVDKLETKPDQHSGIQIFNPAEVASASENQPSVAVNKDSNNFFTPIDHKEIPSSTPAIIPPPPMFSNLPRRDSLSAGKSILPPSVARRISANQPMVKPQVSAAFTENIFVPTIPADSPAIPGYSTSAFVPASPIADPMPKQQEEKPFFIPKEPTSKPDISIPSSQAIQTSYPPNVNVPAQFGSAMPPTSNITNVPPVSFFTPQSKSDSSQPPTFFNPMQTGIQEPHPITQLPPNATPEPTRPIPEPPKATAGNFRMTKKRPQYYAGPIEGVGDISNNVKPTIPTVMPTNTFQGAFFTPAPVEQATEAYASNVDQSSVPFDISQPAIVQQPAELTYQDYSASHLRQGQNQSYDQDFNTSFDLSRATTDAYDAHDAPKQEPKGFGIIGSLKSKLSSIDINKIQNSVTTFFDPAYNDTKVPEVSQENQPLMHQAQNLGGSDNLEIYVGQNTDYNQQYYQTGQYYGQDYSSSYFSDPNASQQTSYAHNTANTHYAYTQQNIPDAGFKNVDNFYNPNFVSTEPSSAPVEVPSMEEKKESTFFNPLPAQEIENIPQNQQNFYSMTENVYNLQSQQTLNPLEVSSGYSNTNTNQNILAPPTEGKNQEPVAFYDPNAFASQEIQKNDTPFNITGQETSGQHHHRKTSSETSQPSDVAGYCDSALNTEKYNVSSSYSNSIVTQIITSPPAKEESQENYPFYNPNAFANQETQKHDAPFDIAGRESSNIHKSSSDVSQPSDVAGYCDSALNTERYNVSSSYSNLHFDAASPTEAQSQENYPFYNPNAFPSQESQNKPFNITGYEQPLKYVYKASSNVSTDADETCDSALNTDKYNLSNIQSVQPIQSKESLISAASFFDNPQTINPQFENADAKPLESAFAKFECTNEETKSFFDPTPTVSVPPIGPIGSKSKTDITCGSEEQKENLTKSLSKDKIPSLGVSSVPLFGHSTLIADATKDTEAENVSLFDKKPYDIPFGSNSASFFENMSKDQGDNLPKVPSDLDISVLKITDVKNVLLMEPPNENIGAVLKRNASSGKLEAKAENAEHFGHNMPSFDQAHGNIIDDQNEYFKHESPAQDIPENVQKTDNLDAEDPELNICETCREVTPDLVESKPKEEDLTTQLIENLTSRISLSHPLTIPFTESDTPEEIPELTEQLQEITDITEDTIETLQFQSATELLDDEMTAKNYGWTEETYSDQPYSHAFVPEKDYDFKIDSEIPAEDYEFKIDPTAIGFFGNNSLFFENVPKNASDEIKAEIKNSHDDIVLPRQMSIPSAPPAEDDSKSDETGGLDVHSIELDAKKDFPLDEEFIIEPSETDDDKIEIKERKRSSEDSNSSDTFTNRIERFKKATDHFSDEAFEKDTQIFNSPPISMASYFDTGNYAVESHYKNSLSPVQMLQYHRPSYEYVSIPPGFEEQYKNMIKDMGPVPDPCIPETSTQTKTTLTPTFSTSQDAKTSETFSGIFGAKTETVESESSPKIVPIVEQNVEKVQTLPDPMNFFAKEDPKPEPQAENFNRLASYFSMPAPQPDHSKSFFELSESQNHYRHEQPADENKKPFFELSQSQNHYIDDVTKNNIADLMLDLTSPQNLCEQIVASVNHFTIELDKDIAKNAAKPIKIDLNNIKLDIEKHNNNRDEPKAGNFNKTDLNTIKVLNKTEKFKTNDLKTEIKLVEKDKSGLNKTDLNSTKDDQTEDFKTCDLNTIKLVDADENLILNCEHCAKLLIFPSKFKVKTAINDNSEPNMNPVMTSETKESNAKKSVSISIGADMEKEPHQSINVLNEPRISSEYTPVKHHWFYRVDVEDKSVWRGFSVTDSKALEDAFNSPDLDENTLVATDGGRFDVNIVGRLRIAVYWKEKPTNVRRCSWYYKGTTDSRYVPYTETVAEKLEEEYRHGVLTGEWHRKLALPNSEMVIMHGPSVMVHFLQSSATDAFTTPPQATSRPRVVRRGHEESEIEDCEPSRIEHLLLLCHGVGSACDLRFRSVEEVVDDFRTTSFQLLQSHYKNSYDNGMVNRIEVLPISWHAQLHSGESGVDSRLSRVTLESIPRLRAFTNNTVLDVLFYTSPVFQQMIVDTVCSEMNRVYELFKSRNPSFTGHVSLGGHSLGSVILYDLLCHQTTESFDNSAPPKTFVSTATETQSNIKYPQLKFHPAALYALGSPIAIFECIRGVESLGLNFQLPTCKNFFNIFHPYDPIAYRIEPLINSELQLVKPELIPHHKGRKRMHLELKDTMTRVGADLKQKLIESVRTTWNKWTAPNNDGHLEKVVEEDMEKEQLCDDKEDKASELQATSEMLGRLNNGRRIDYVLQEAPLEMINEYLFAMSSHVGYWESEDTMLLMLREVYSSLGVQPDVTVPQQCMTVNRARVDDASIISEKDHPSTSRGRTL